MNISPNLGSDLLIHLSNARELYVSVALMNEYGLDTLCTSPADCKKQIAIGIDLPTRPSVLRRLLELNQQNELTNARIFKKIEVFHPKLYIIVKPIRQLIAFIGSSNATNGGFDRNIEINICINDQDTCRQLLLWHQSIYERCEDFDERFINDYELVYKKNRRLGSIQRSNNKRFRNNINNSIGTGIQINNGQFFRQSYFDAFSATNHFREGPEILELRKQVKERFLALSESIYPMFSEYEIDDLHRPVSKNNYVSQHWISRGNTHIEKDAIWLHYGKNARQLNAADDERFNHNLRMQVIIRNNTPGAYVGIWLFIGKPNACLQDRRGLKQKLANDYFLSLFFNYLSELGDAYFVRIEDHYLYVDELTNTDNLRQYLLRDDYAGYYVIGRNYDPNDPDLSEENIAKTVLIEFGKLFKLYRLILNGT